MTLEAPAALLYALPLASARLIAFMLTAPIFGHAGVPMRVRVMIAVVLALLISPIAAAHAAVGNPGPIEMAGLVAREGLIGSALGFGLRVIFDVFAPVGEIVSIQGGLGAANAIDPSSGASSAVLGVVLQIFAMVVFLAVDGHHALIRGIAASYDRLPIGGAALPSEVFAFIASLGSSLYEVAARLAAPLTVMMLVTNVGVGILGRAIPQLNLMALQLPANIALTLVIFALIANVLGEAIADALIDSTGHVLASLLGTG